MADDELEDFLPAARITVREAPIHEVLLLAEIEIHTDLDDLDAPKLADLSDPLLAQRQKDGIIAGHSFYMMRSPIWIDDPEVDYQAGEFDAINGLLPAMIYTITDTRCDIFAANEMLVPALALGEEESFWHHPAFSTSEIWRLCLAILGMTFSTHEPMLVVQAIDRGTSNHQKLETRWLFKGLIEHSTLSDDSGDGYFSLDVMGEYQLGFFSPKMEQSAGRLIPPLPDRLEARDAVFPFLADKKID